MEDYESKDRCFLEDYCMRCEGMLLMEGSPKKSKPRVKFH
jgi:hypothetical protein